MKNILIINICKEKLHYYEFVKPIEDILKTEGISYFIKRYNDINKKDLEKSSHVIISGTSLYDNEFIIDLKKFEWIKNLEKPILGICSGMQIIQLIFLEEELKKIKRKTEIGFFKEDFIKNFLGLEKYTEVYHLHNYYAKIPEGFEEYTCSKIPQAIKHRNRSIYGVLFHPEVRQKTLITNFCKL
jgi:GMP synthase-like glutamine amidotransferase